MYFVEQKYTPICVVTHNNRLHRCKRKHSIHMTSLVYCRGIAFTSINSLNWRPKAWVFCKHYENITNQLPSRAMLVYHLIDTKFVAQMKILYFLFHELLTPKNMFAISSIRWKHSFILENQSKTHEECGDISLCGSVPRERGWGCRGC